MSCRKFIVVMEIFDQSPGDISYVSLSYFIGFYEIFDMFPLDI